MKEPSNVSPPEANVGKIRVGTLVEPRRFPWTKGRPVVPVTSAGPELGLDPVPSKRRLNRNVIVTLIGMALFVGGVGLGYIFSDPTRSDEYVALKIASDSAVEDRDQIARDRKLVAAERDELKRSQGARDTASGKREAAVAAAEEALVTREEAIAKREAAMTAKEQIHAKNSFGDGTRTVGTDIEPGTYRTNADVSSSCYWAILTSGTNGDDIVSNDIPGGGRPTVIVAVGQDFNSTRCGTWTKQ